MIDTGAVFSVIPHSSSEPACGQPIMLASGKPIPCWDWKDQLVKFGGQEFRWTFLFASVAFLLLGTDFLAKFKMIGDLDRFCVNIKYDF
jgi:hypothetical protein